MYPRINFARKFRKGVQFGDINYVELVGTIHSHLSNLPSGRNTIVVQTVEEPRKLYHVASTMTRESFAIGQRVQLTGCISSQNVLVDQQLHQRLMIKATEFHLCSPDIRDGSRVRLLAAIASDIENHSDYSQFILTTRHTPRGGKGNGIFVTEFIKVMVHDKKLRNYVHDHLAKSKRVLVSGMIRYSLYTNAEGKERSSGYIEAASLQ